MILVIGAESFIGTYLVDALVRHNETVIVTGRKIESNKYFRKLNSVKPINLDISDKEDFKKLPQDNIDVVIHLAGIMPANVDLNHYNPYSYIDINIKGTLNILKYARKIKVSKFIYTSSESDIAMQYGKYEILNEEIPRAINYNNDHTIYAITKIASMDLIEHYSQKYNIQGIYFRLPNIFGYGQLLEHYVDGKKVLNGFGTFLLKATRGEDIEVWGDPNRGRDIVYVKDLVQMFLGAIDSKKARGLYCVGTGIKTTLLEQIEGIIKIFSKNKIPELIFKPDKPSIREYVYDISKAKKDLGYIPKYSYLKMLEDWKNEFQLNRFPHLEQRVKILKEVKDEI